MFRKSLDRFSGMLFVYDQEQEVNFWMRNTLIPLDLLFFNSKGILKNIHQNAQPLDLTNIFGGNSIQYVMYKSVFSSYFFIFFILKKKKL